jgi:hypothetical protein
MYCNEPDFENGFIQDGLNGVNDDASNETASAANVNEESSNKTVLVIIDGGVANEDGVVTEP